MTKKEFIEKYAKATGETSKRTEELTNIFMSIVTEGLEKTGLIQFTGFGTFEVRERAARIGRNPQNGKELKIPAKKVVKFKVGKVLAENVKNSK